MEVSRVWGAAALIIFVLIGGCAKVPIEELEGYRSAFSQVSAVSGALYEEAAKVVTEVEAAQLALGRGGEKVRADLINPPTDFDPSQVTGPGERVRDLPEPIALRVCAMQTVIAYNDALVAHVSGDPLEKVVAPLKAAAGQIEGFAALASSIPVKELGLGPITELGSLAINLNPFASMAPGAIEGLKGLARLGLQAKAESEMREALLAGYGPVQEVLTILEADSGQLYGFQKVRCGLTRYEALNANGKTLTSIDGLSEAFARPTQAPISTTVDTLEQRMTASVIAIYQPSTDFDPCGSGKPEMKTPKKVGFFVRKFPYEFPFAKQQGRPMNGNAAQALDVFVTEYESNATRTVAARESLRNYHSQVLPDYVILLRNAKRGLQIVSISAKRQPALAEKASDLIMIAANIRSNIDSIRSANKTEAKSTFP